MHFGANYAPITAFQEDQARWLVRLGVDVVAGHHPHDVQALEVRGRRVIFYSLGNYAWGAPGREMLRVGLLARLHLTPRIGRRPSRLVSVDLLPVVTQNRFVRFQPRRIRSTETGWLGSVLAESRRRGAQIIADEGGTAFRVVLPP
jgi:poly-gamma-glutamate synthesis protein (capsule biosynthesis protein)